jgi:hypothetical protein
LLTTDERERAKRELAEEQAEAAALLVAQKEAMGSDVQVAAEHAQKMANKWEKITAKEVIRVPNRPYFT